MVAHETVGLRMLFAAAIIIAGVAIITASKGKKPIAPPVSNTAPIANTSATKTV
jgi:drug/metabolite transporter (DMT)-like permease